MAENGQRAFKVPAGYVRLIREADIEFDSVNDSNATEAYLQPTSSGRLLRNGNGRNLPHWLVPRSTPS